ncbi:hypothetical protein Tco_0291587 [Tanacetum coccineum]
MREGRLIWFGHVKRRPQSAPVRRVETIVVDGVRRRGRPKLRWEDKLKTDLKELLLSEEMTSDRNSWRTMIRLLQLLHHSVRVSYYCSFRIKDLSPNIIYILSIPIDEVHEERATLPWLQRACQHQLDFVVIPFLK